MLLPDAGSGVALVTCAVFVIQPPPFPVTVVGITNETELPLESDGSEHVTTRVDELYAQPAGGDGFTTREGSVSVTTTF